MPFMYTEQFRHKTLHPAIQGLLNRQKSYTTVKDRFVLTLMTLKKNGAPQTE